MTDISRASAAPLLVAAGAILMFTALDGMIKSLPAGLPIVEIVVLRYACGLPAAFAVAWRVRHKLLNLGTWRANGARGVLSLCTALTFFFALRMLGFAEALALSFLGPLFLAGFAGMLLGEKPTARLIGALLLGLAGVAVILAGDINAAPRSLAGTAAALGSAVFYALSNVLLRLRAQREPGQVIVLIQRVVPCVLAAPFAAAEWVAPSMLAWATLATLAMIGLAAHLALTWAFARAPAGALGVMDYTALPWAAAIGYGVFAEVPPLAMWLGAALIVGACLLTARR